MAFWFVAGTSLGIRISLVSCAGKRKHRNQQKTTLFFQVIRLEFAERCDCKTKRFYLGHFWSVLNTYAYPAEITSKYV